MRPGGPGFPGPPAAAFVRAELRVGVRVTWSRTRHSARMNIRRG